MKLKNKLLTTILASTTVVATSLSAVSLASCGGQSKHEDVESKYFEIENGVLKGFKKNLSEEQKKEAVKDGVLKLPAVKVIGANAFNDTVAPAPYAEVIEIPASVTEIGEKAFYGNRAKKITWTGGVEASDLQFIRKEAFAFCTNLESFAFPKGLFKPDIRLGMIGEAAFFCCEKLSELDLHLFNSDISEYMDQPAWTIGAFKGLPKDGKVLFTNPSSSEQSKLETYNCAHIFTRLTRLGLSTSWLECWNDTSKTPWAEQIKIVPYEYLTITNDVLSGADETLWPTDERGYNTVLVPSNVTALDSSASGATINAFLAERSRTDMSGHTTGGITCWLFNWTQITEVPQNICNSIHINDVPVEAYWPSTITTIGAHAFDDNNWYNDFPDQANITTISDKAFYNSGLTGWKFGTGIKKVGAEAFCAPKLKSLDFTDFTSSTPGGTWGDDVFETAGVDTGTNENIVNIYSDSPTLVDTWRLKESFTTFLAKYQLELNEGDPHSWSFQPTGYISLNNLFNIDKDGVLHGWALDGKGNPLKKDEVAKILAQLKDPDKPFTGTLTIPSSVTSIAANAFYDGSASTMPDNVTAIAFANDNLTAIGDNAFNGASSVKTLTLPKKIQTIGENAFYGLGITSIKLPSTLTNVGKQAFYLCASLAEIDMSEWTTPFVLDWSERSIFTKCASPGKVITPEINNALDQWRINYPIKQMLLTNGLTFASDAWSFTYEDNATLVSMDNSKVVTGWIKDSNNKEITDDEKPILAKDKYGSESLVIPDGATGVANGAFVKDMEHGDYSSTIPATLTKIIVEGSTCTTIGEKAFFNAWNGKAQGKAIELGKATGLTTVGADAFGCANGGVVELSSSLTSIGQAAFSGTTMFHLTIPKFENPITFGLGAFAINPKLASINMTAYGDDLPDNWSNITDILSSIATSGNVTIKDPTTSANKFVNFLATCSDTIAKNISKWKEKAPTP